MSIKGFFGEEHLLQYGWRPHREWLQCLDDEALLCAKLLLQHLGMATMEYAWKHKHNLTWSNTIKHNQTWSNLCFFSIWMYVCYEFLLSQSWGPWFWGRPATLKNTPAFEGIRVILKQNYIQHCTTSESVLTFLHLRCSAQTLLIAHQAANHGFKTNDRSTDPISSGWNWMV